MEDNQLVERAARGDRDAFAILFERYRRYVYSIAYKVALDVEDSLDITQTVFLKLASKIGQFNGQGTFRGWLATIAAREAIDYTRRPSRRETVTSPEVLEEISEHSSDLNKDNPRKALEAAERRELAELAMVNLSPQQRAVVMLRMAEDMGPKEIAERLGLPDKQVRVQLHRAVKKVRKALQGKVA